MVYAISLAVKLPDLSNPRFRKNVTNHKIYRQLFEAINFAFVKMFDSVVKTANFQSIFPFSERFISHNTAHIEHSIYLSQTPAVSKLQ